MILTELIQD